MKREAGFAEFSIRSVLIALASGTHQTRNKDSPKRRLRPGTACCSLTLLLTGSSVNQQESFQFQRLQALYLAGIQFGHLHLYGYFKISNFFMLGAIDKSIIIKARIEIKQPREINAITTSLLSLIADSVQISKHYPRLPSYSHFHIPQSPVPLNLSVGEFDPYTTVCVVSKPNHFLCFSFTLNSLAFFPQLIPT